MGTARPSILGGTIAVSDSTALAMLSAEGLPPGSRIFNEAVGNDFILTISVAALDPDVVVEVLDTVGARWIIDTSGGGAFPGFGGTGAATGVGTNGAAPTAARGDHGHATLVAATAAAMSALTVTSMLDGTLCYVTSKDGVFRLQTSALTTNTWDTFASATAGRQWLREAHVSETNAAQPTWTVNTTAGDDDAAVGGTLKTMSELAWRLAGAKLTVTVTVTLVGSMVASDRPYFTFVVSTALGIFSGFNIVGTPTNVFTGTASVAGYAGGTAAPAVDDTRFTDATVPVSFTASGMLANGILFRRTNGTEIDWFAAKDLGAKTLRISKPFDAATYVNADLADGDSYVAEQLPTVQEMHFLERRPGTVQLSKVMAASGSTWLSPALICTKCWMGDAILAPIILFQCAFTGGGQLNGSSYTSLPAIINGGLFRGTGASQFVVQNCASLSLGSSNKITLQGCQIQFQRGFTLIEGDIASYDHTGFPLSANYWAIVLWYTGAFAGNGNAKLASAGIFSQLAHVVTPLWLAGSATDVVTPINVHGTGGMTVAAEAGGGGNVNAQQNGIFVTS